VGKCVIWSVDSATNTCKGASDNPHCNTVADCPTTKYCAGDPGRLHGGAASADCSYGGVTDDCCAGGSSFGPCLVWDTCDPVRHICLRTRQAGQTTVCGGKTLFKYGDVPCAGGPTGLGGINGGLCNNACQGGRCTSNYLVCK
jgi:hypothetical protein